MNNQKTKGKQTKSGFLLLFFLFSLYQAIPGQEFLGFKEIITGSYNVAGSTSEQGVKPILIDATTEGGILEVSVKFKQAGNQFCTAKYRFEWNFSESVDQLSKGQSIPVDYRSTLLSSPCSSANAKMIVTEAIGISPFFKQTGVKGVGGLTVENKKWTAAGTSTKTSTSTLKIFNTSNQYATIKINFESTGIVGSERLHFEVVYLFEKGLRPQQDCDPDLNCHNLYSVGVLIGFAEYGASKNDDPKVLAEHLAGAIIHAQASKCVPTDGLQKMMNKLRVASSSRSLHTELTHLRDQIAKYVEQNCNCCN